MTPKVTVTFNHHADLCGQVRPSLWPRKVTGVIKGRRDLLYEPNGHDYLFGRLDLVNDPKRSQG